MSLFQKAPASVEEAERWRPLEIGPDQVLELSEEEWYTKVYRGADAPQLTWRAVLLGSLLGFFLALTNLYVGLKSGWALGVVITAAIVANSMWRLLLRVGVARSPMTILETNCMASTASSAGYATGGTMVSAIAALLMLSAKDKPGGEHLPVGVLLMWTLFLGALGTVMAIPMKRNMINQERLKFPTGTAAAVTLQSLYSEGEKAARKARALFKAALVGAVFPLLIELRVVVQTTVDAATGAVEKARVALLPGTYSIFDALGMTAAGTHLDAAGREVTNRPSDWTMVWDNNPVMIAAGALVGLRITIWMAIGGLFLAYGLGPAGLADTWTTPNGEVVAAVTAPARAWKESGIWNGVSIMVASGLLAFAFQWRTIVRAFAGFFRGPNRESSSREDLVNATEVPISWFLVGTLLSGAAVVWLAWDYFGIPVGWGALAVVLTFFLSIVACRATGESDITPTGAMGKVMQLTYGALIPQNSTANLMTASITASSASSAADLLSDLKSGYLLGANPRRQFVAQFCGIFAGTFATVFGFRLLVRDANTLTREGTDFPAPAAQAWLKVAEVFRDGIGNLHPTHFRLILIGLSAGVVIQTLETFLPRWKKWLPSATGLGLGLILPFQYPLSMLAGAVLAAVWKRSNPERAETYVVPISAGLIAGVSIIGVLIALANGVMDETWMR